MLQIHDALRRSAYLPDKHFASVTYSSSTHASSYVIHFGRVASLNRDGLTFSQNVPSCMFRQVFTGLIDHRPLCAKKNVRKAGPNTDPDGG